jgi:hypothetical protein
MTKYEKTQEQYETIRRPNNALDNLLSGRTYEHIFEERGGQYNSFRVEFKILNTYIFSKELVSVDVEVLTVGTMEYSRWITYQEKCMTNKLIKTIKSDFDRFVKLNSFTKVALYNFKTIFPNTIKL